MSGPEAASHEWSWGIRCGSPPSWSKISNFDEQRIVMLYLLLTLWEQTWTHFIWHLTRFSRCVSVSHLYIQYIGLSMLRHRHADMCHGPVGAGETPLWVVGCNTADEDQMRISDNSRFSCPYHPRHVVSSHCCCEGPHLCANILYFLHRWMQQKKMLCWSPCEQVFLGPRYPASRL